MTVRMSFTAFLCALCFSCLTSTASAGTAPIKKDAAEKRTAEKETAPKAVAKAVSLKKKLLPYSYDYAHHETIKTGKPLLVFIGAEWCGACVQMKHNVIPDLKKSRLIKNVSFAVVDFDENRKLGKNLTDGGPIPQTILFCKDKKGWHTHKLVGGQNLENVESLIKESLAHAPKAKEEVVADQKIQTR